MAGIGFELRKLLHRDDLSGIVAGMTRATVLSTGPWIFTVLSLAGIDTLGPQLVARTELTEFQLVIFYNFAFSLVVSGPILTVVTRYLSDLVYGRRTREAMGLLVGSLALLLAVQCPVVAVLYFYFARLSLMTGLCAGAGFFLITGIWLLQVFLTTLHNDRSVAITFIVGCLTSCAAGLALGPRYSTAGMLLGYNIGLGLVFFTLLARVLAEYPAALASPFAFARTFRKHWLLAAGGLAYNVAIWADKWVMWSAPEAVRHPCGLVSFTNYDSAMFLAFLSIIPAISLFVTNVETRFYEIYLRYLRNIREHAPWSVLERDQRDILATIFSGARQILVWQGLVTAGLLLIAPRLLEMSGIAFIQLGMFRLGLLGAFFHAQFLFLLILLSYFELYRETVLLQLLFLATNTLFTRLTLELGLPWYGCGYAMAAVLSFAAAAATAFRLLPGVAFETFIRRNAALCASGFDDTASPEDDRRRSASPTGG